MEYVSDVHVCEQTKIHKSCMSWANRSRCGNIHVAWDMDWECEHNYYYGLTILYNIHIIIGSQVVVHDNVLHVIKSGDHTCITITSLYMTKLFTNF